MIFLYWTASPKLFHVLSPELIISSLMLETTLCLWDHHSSNAGTLWITVHSRACPGLFIASKPLLVCPGFQAVWLSGRPAVRTLGDQPHWHLLSLLHRHLNVCFTFFWLCRGGGEALCKVSSQRVSPKGAGSWLDHGLFSRWQTVIFT